MIHIHKWTEENGMGRETKVGEWQLMESPEK